MPERELIPSIDMRLSSLLEINRRREIEREARSKSGKSRPAITISREFGCEAYPMAVRLRELLEEKSGETWVLVDKGLQEEVARNHNLSEDILKRLGEKYRFLDEMLGTFTPRWKSEKDYFRLLCRHIVSLASDGNVIIIGRGSSIVTQPMKNCHHFRLYASMDFKVRSISRRLNIPTEDAETLIVKKQHQRDSFVRDFLDRDAGDLSIYNLVFNNDKNTPERTARTIMEYVLSA